MYIETALVSSAGKLLIQLSDGQVIDAGYVKGSQGLPGRDGADGSPGIPGAKGDPGTNGARWHTGVGAPEIVLGENGDLYMDVASALLPIYQKVNGDWLFLCNLKVPPSGGGGGAGGGAAGGGGAVILYPMPDGGKPPSTDNDGKPVDKGDIWLDTNTGWLWVWNGSQWLPVADRPPVIISPTPPDYNNASNEDPNKPPQYTVKEGDLWFDSDQLATYVAVKNTADELVWVIATPHNRVGIASEITRDYPIYAFSRASDKQIEYNPTTDTEYIYNAPKNQWIDLSQMVHYGAQPPCHAPKGAVFTDEETLKQFVHQGGCVWVEQTSCGAGPGSGSLPGNLTAVEFRQWRCRKYFGDILHEIWWETQEGIHFDDEITFEVDMNNSGTWEDVSLMDDAQKTAYGITNVFNLDSGSISFVFNEGSNPLGPYPVQANYPCAQFRITIKNVNLEDPNDFTIKSSAPTFVYPEYTQDWLDTPVPAHPGAGC